MAESGSDGHFEPTLPLEFQFRAVQHDPSVNSRSE